MYYFWVRIQGIHQYFFIFRWFIFFIYFQKFTFEKIISNLQVSLAIQKSFRELKVGLESQV